MNVRDYQALTRILNKVLYRISLCLNKVVIEATLIEWKFNKYNISLSFECNNSSIFVSAKGYDSDHRKAAKLFLDNILVKIKREVASCEEIEKSAKKDWDMYQYIDESTGNMMMKTSFEMLLSSLKEVLKEIERVSKTAHAEPSVAR